MIEELGRMRQFLASDLSGSNVPFSFVSSSIEAVEKTLRNVSADIVHELNECVTRKSTTSTNEVGDTNFSGSPAIRVPLDWRPHQPMRFEFDKVGYEAIPPSACKPGDYMRFDPATRILYRLS